MRQLFLGLCVLLLANQAFAAKQWIYISGPSNPAVIFRCTLDTESGEFGELEVAAENVQSGFMALHPNLPLLYAGTSKEKSEGKPNGLVKLYRIHQKNGMLEFLDQTETDDSGTTHIQVSPTGEAVLVCHYGGEGTSSIPLESDGSLQHKVSRIKHSGSSVNEKRQKRPHPHGVAVAENGKFVAVADLGNDHVEVFAINDGYELAEHTHWEAEPGAGPRHVTFHPSGRWLYCLNELDSTLNVLNFSPLSGKLKEMQAITTLPADFSGNNTTAEVAISPKGKFLYCSNRGHNSTAVFAVNPLDGKVKLVEHEPTQGDHPRFVGIDPTGHVYLAANMLSNNVVSFIVDRETGELSPSGHTLEVPRPMCIVFVEQE